eukprot:GEMP01006677.1.p1 GENE.GEMP01006677.1~~GEMP01006677.1.p1  ORF type:complete len:914 (+),score=222.88 GEMP01006677.1:176-2917(+)
MEFQRKIGRQSRFFLPVLKVATERRRRSTVENPGFEITSHAGGESFKQELEYLRNKLHQYKEQHAVLLESYNRNIVIVDQRVEEKKLMVQQSKLLADKIELRRAQVDEGYTMAKGDQNAVHMLEELIEKNAALHPTMKNDIERGQQGIEEHRRQLELKKQDLECLQTVQIRHIEDQKAMGGFGSGHAAQRASRRAPTLSGVKVLSTMRHIWEEEFATMLEQAYTEIAEKKNLVREQQKILEAMQMTSVEGLRTDLQKWDRRYRQIKKHLDESVAGSNAPKTPVRKTHIRRQKNADAIADIHRVFREFFSQPRAQTIKRLKRARKSRCKLVSTFSPLWDYAVRLLLPVLPSICEDPRGLRRQLVEMNEERKGLINKKVRMRARIFDLLSKRKKRLSSFMWNYRVEEDDLKSHVHKLKTEAADLQRSLDDAFNFGDRAHLATVHRFLDEQREILANSIVDDENDDYTIARKFPIELFKQGCHGVEVAYHNALVSILERGKAEHVATIEQIQYTTHSSMKVKLPADELTIKPPQKRKAPNFARRRAKPVANFTEDLDGIPYTRNVSVGNTTTAGAQTDNDEHFMTEHVIYSGGVTFGEMQGVASVSILGERHMSMRIMFDVFDMPLFIYSPLDFIVPPSDFSLKKTTDVDETWEQIGEALVSLIDIDYEKSWPRFLLRGLNERTCPQQSDILVTDGPSSTLGTLMLRASLFKPSDRVTHPRHGMTKTATATHSVDFLDVNIYERPRTLFARHYYHIQCCDVSSGWSQWALMEYRFLLYFLDLPMVEHFDPKLIVPSKLRNLIVFAWSGLDDICPTVKRERDPMLSLREVVDADEPLARTWSVADMVHCVEEDDALDSEEEEDDFGRWEDRFEPGISLEFILSGEEVTCSCFRNCELGAHTYAPSATVNMRIAAGIR